MGYERWVGGSVKKQDRIKPYPYKALAFCLKICIIFIENTSNVTLKIR